MTKLVMMKHPTRSFNFAKPGDPFEVAADDVDKLRKLGCVLAHEKFTTRLVEVLDYTEPVAAVVDSTHEVIANEEGMTLGDEVEVPVRTSPDSNWWIWNGEKYNGKSNLPPAALAALEATE